MEKLVPRLRFPGFDGEWEKKRLSKITSRIGDGIHGTPKYNELGEYYFINGNNLNNGRIIYGMSTKKVDFEEFDKQKIVLNSTSILMSINGTIGNLALFVNEKVLLGKSACYINVDEGCDKYFIYFVLQTDKLQNYFTSNLSGSTIKNLSLGSIRDTLVYIPAFNEQNKISLYLQAVELKLAHLQKKKTLLEQYKKGMMQKIFDRELRCKDEDGMEFGEWKMVKLGDFATITTGLSNRVDSNLDGEYTFFDRSQDIRSSDRFLFDAEAIIVPGEGQEFIPKHFIGKFDLHQRTYAIMDFSNNYGKFLFYSITYNKGHLNSQAVGSTVKSLRLPMFQSMPIQLPNLNEQTKIANFLSAIDKKITLVAQQIEKMEHWKKGVLCEVFV